MGLLKNGGERCVGRFLATHCRPRSPSGDRSIGARNLRGRCLRCHPVERPRRLQGAYLVEEIDVVIVNRSLAALERGGAVYDLVVAEITVLPRGPDASAAVSQVDLADGTRGFLKARFGYPFVDGASGMDAGLHARQWEAYGAALRHIHAAPVSLEIVGLLKRATLTPRDAPLLRYVRYRVGGRGDIAFARLLARVMSIAHALLPTRSRLAFTDGLGSSDSSRSTSRSGSRNVPVRTCTRSGA